MKKKIFFEYVEEPLDARNVFSTYLDAPEYTLTTLKMLHGSSSWIRSKRHSFIPVQNSFYYCDVAWRQVNFYNDVIRKNEEKKKTKKSFLISKRLRRRKYCLRSVIIPNYYSTKVIKCSAQFSCWDIIVLEICDNVAVQILLKNEKKLFDQNICYIPESAPSDSSKGLKSIEM